MCCVMWCDMIWCVRTHVCMVEQESIQQLMICVSGQHGSEIHWTIIGLQVSSYFWLSLFSVMVIRNRFDTLQTKHKKILLSDHNFNCMTKKRKRQTVWCPPAEVISNRLNRFNLKISKYSSLEKGKAIHFLAIKNPTDNTDLPSYHSKCMCSNFFTLRRKYINKRKATHTYTRVVGTS